MTDTVVKAKENIRVQISPKRSEWGIFIGVGSIDVMLVKDLTRIGSKSFPR